MALVHLDFHSDTLGMAVSCDVILPQKSKNLIGMKTESSETFPTLWLLHGLSDDHTIWQRRTSIERYAAERGIAVVMPNCQRSWYSDMKYGGAFFTFLTDELPAVCRSFFKGMSAERDMNLIAGLSMGGYGALKCALTYPERYRAAASLSGAFDVAAYANGKSLMSEAQWYATLGDLDKITGSKNDLFHIATLAAEKAPLPELYIWCGTEDFLLSSNRRLKAHLDEKGIAHTYQESEGNHGWGWWDLHIQDVLRFFFDQKK